jgi:hypothetical protein
MERLPIFTEAVQLILRSDRLRQLDDGSAVALSGRQASRAAIASVGRPW